MDLKEWEEHWAAFLRRQAEIDEHYQWRLALIDRQQKVSTFFLIGYVVMLFTAIGTGNPVLMGAAAICMLVVVGSLAWMTYQIAHTRYPGDKS